MEERKGHMGLLDRVNAGAERAAMEAWKAFDKGKAKAAELQLEMRMDAAAKRLGYLVLDEHRGRLTDGQARQRMLDDLARLEDEMAKLRAETAARVAARGSSTASRPSEGQSTGSRSVNGEESAAGQARNAGAEPSLVDDSGAWSRQAPDVDTES